MLNHRQVKRVESQMSGEREFRHKTLQIDWSNSQGGSIEIVGEEEKGDINERNNPFFETFGLIATNEKHPIEYTTQEIIDWMNTTINMFGVERFKKMVSILKDNPDRE